MTNPAPSLQTILFSDIAGSTGLYERLGDALARHLVASALKLMADTAASCQGRLIKTIGDEVMCCFDTPDLAARSAIAMQERITTEPEMVSHQIQLRIGMHHGAAIEDGGDLYGDAVNVASRMVDQAKAGQIITTQETLQMLETRLADSARLVDQTLVKGKQSPIDIYELSWGQPEEVTIIGISPLGLNGCAPTDDIFLTLDLQQQHVCVNHEQPIVTIGRDSGNRIVVSDPKVSRLHARVEMRRNKFVLVDQSTNGTYVLPDNGRSVHLRRDEMVLEGEGCIRLGQETETDPALSIRYQAT